MLHEGIIFPIMQRAHFACLGAGPSAIPQDYKAKCRVVVNTLIYGRRAVLWPDIYFDFHCPEPLRALLRDRFADKEVSEDMLL